MSSTLPKFITFTGLDQWTDLNRVKELSSRYPIEWGILFSPKLQGNHPRYPSLYMVGHITRALGNLNLAAHLCGDHARTILTKADCPDLTSWIDCAFGRFQINTSDPSAKPSMVAEFAEKFGGVGIMQCRDPRTFDVGYVDWLYDRSAGTGELPDRWASPSPNGDAFVGYAGGLGPDTVTAALAAIQANHVDGQRYWIDMETGIRTDDRLDLDKCEAVCRAVYGEGSVRAPRPKKDPLPSPAPSPSEIAELLRRFAACVTNDNGDVTVSTGGLTSTDWVQLKLLHETLAVDRSALQRPYTFSLDHLWPNEALRVAAADRARELFHRAETLDDQLVWQGALTVLKASIPGERSKGAGEEDNAGRLRRIEDQMRQHGGVDSYDIEWLVSSIRRHVSPFFLNPELADGCPAEAITEEMRVAGMNAAPMFPMPEMAGKSGRASLSTQQVGDIYRAMREARGSRFLADGEYGEVSASFYDLANQLGGYVDMKTPEREAEFLLLMKKRAGEAGDRHRLKEEVSPVEPSTTPLPSRFTNLPGETM